MIRLLIAKLFTVKLKSHHELNTVKKCTESHAYMQWLVTVPVRASSMYVLL